MKVLREIIGYLDSRGSLSAKDRGYLLEQGYLPRPAPEPAESLDPAPAEEAHELEWDRLADAQAAEDRKRASGGRGRQAVLEAPELGRWLSGQIRVWRRPLEGLLRLARRLAPEARLRDAPQALLEAPAGDLAEALALGLKAQEPALRTLWPALGFEGYREAVQRPDLGGGPAAGAFRAVLSGAGRDELGRHGWILKRPPVRFVYHLVQAQRRTLSALWGLHGSRPEALALALRRGGPEAAYWTCVLLYNACRRAGSGPEVQAWPAYGERAPQRPAAERGVWEQAWKHALLAAPAALPFFLEACGRHQAPPEAADLRLFCPAGWDW